MKMKCETILLFPMKFHYPSRRLKSLFNNLKASKSQKDKKVLRLPNALLSRIFLLIWLNIRRIKNVKSDCYKNVYCYQEIFINIFQVYRRKLEIQKSNSASWFYLTKTKVWKTRKIFQSNLVQNLPMAARKKILLCVTHA